MTFADLRVLYVDDDRINTLLFTETCRDEPRLTVLTAACPDEALDVARSVAAVRPLPLVRNLPSRHPLGDAYFQFARNMVGGMSKNFPAPLK
jgi:CheY-like chemotaxis protein